MSVAPYITWPLHSVQPIEKFRMIWKHSETGMLQVRFSNGDKINIRIQKLGENVQILDDICRLSKHIYSVELNL